MRKIFSKNFKSNFYFIIIVVSIFSLASFSLLQYRNNSSVKKEILLIEQQKLLKTNEFLQLRLEQLTQTSGYFASMTLVTTDDSGQELDFNWYTKLNDKASSCIALMDINYIKVYNDDASFETGTGEFDEDNPMPVGELNASNILFTKKNDYILFKMTPQENEYAKNNVLIIMSAYRFGGGIFGNGSDENTFNYVVNKDGKIILSDNQGLLGDNISEYHALSQGDIKSSERMITAGKTSYSCCIERIGDLDMYSVRVTDQKVYKKYYSSMIFNGFLLGAALIVIAFLLSMLISYRTYRPLRTLIRSLHDYIPDIAAETSIDEVAYIHDNIAKLYRSNKNLNQAVHDDVIRLKNMQVMAHQSQISPHFIYNTLDTISYSAKDLLGRYNPLSRCIINMANVIKYSMDTSSLFTTLEEEIRVTKTYIEILSVRYDNGFEVEWEVDDSLLNHRVIKVCMQPLIENAVFHGLTEDNTNGKIKIRIGTEDDIFKIEIRDNGVGIPEDVLERIIAHINEFDKQPADKIGLRNVNLRLKLMYGEKYGLFIESSVGQGTVCALHMPIEE